jgi:hypothetical protein
MKNIFNVVIFLSLYYCLVVSEAQRPFSFPKQPKPKSNISCSPDRHLEDTLKCECKLGVSFFFAFKFKIRVIISDLLLKVNFDCFFFCYCHFYSISRVHGDLCFSHMQIICEGLIVSLLLYTQHGQ